jgi:predicted DNA-binding WGR domain protein
MENLKEKKDVMIPHIGLQAVSLDNSIARYYNIHISLDLFSHWSLLINYGGIGSKSRRKHYSYPSFLEMTKKLASILHRRKTASTRIGCGYKLIWLNNKNMPEIQNLVSSFWPGR